MSKTYDLDHAVEEIKRRLTPEALHLLTLPPKQWEEFVNTMTEDERQNAQRGIDALMQGGARLSGYLDVRGATGNGDGGHTRGVAKSNKMAEKVRKALGYTYPKSDINF